MGEFLSLILAILTAIFSMVTNIISQPDVPHVGPPQPTVVIEEKYTEKEIEENPLVFGIGKTKSNYVVAVFNEDFTEVTIEANHPDSDGEMVDWILPGDPMINPMFNNRATLTTVNIGKYVTSIGDYAFINCKNITGKIEFPNSVERIGRCAFENDSGITGLNFNNGVREINNYAFDNCTGLTGRLYLTGTTEFIGTSAFNATGITGIQFGRNVGFIGTAAFQSCKSMTEELVLPKSLFVIGDFAFNHMYGVPNETIFIPENVAHIGGTSYNKPREGISTISTNPHLGEAYTYDYDINGYNVDNYRTADYANTGTHTFYRLGANVGNFTKFEVSELNNNFKAVDGILYTADGERLVSVPTFGHDDVVMEEGCRFIDELAAHNVKNLTIANSYTIQTYPEAPVTQINYQNTLTDALYRTGIKANVYVKPENTKYKSVDGALYSIDGKICYHANFINGTLTIADGCERVEGIIRDTLGFKSISLPEDVSFVINIPASVNFIANYDSETYTKQGDIDSINAAVDAVGLVVNVDSKNNTYTVDKDGYLITKPDAMKIPATVSMMKKSLTSYSTTPLDAETPYYIIASNIAKDSDINKHLPAADGVTYEVDNVSKSGYYGTGTIVHAYDKDKQLIADYLLVVLGDIDCDGAIDVLDATIVERIKNGHIDIGNGAEFMAADTNRDGKIDETDYDNCIDLALGDNSTYVEFYNSYIAA